MDDVFLNRVKQGYSTAAIVLLNTIAVFVVLNVVLYGAFYVWDGGLRREPRRPPDDDKLFNSDGSPARTEKRSYYQLRWFDYTAYGAANEYVSNVLDDFYDLSRLGFVFQPWIHHSEPPFAGKLVHIDRDAAGFPIRRTINPKADGLPVAHVFTLGGSTTFGYNVSDEHTWPSYLSTILNERAKGIRIEITNYGRGYFNPSQETILLTDLLKSGHRPSLLIFMDGVNPPSITDEPNFTDELKSAMRKIQFRPSYTEPFQWLPVMRLANFLRRRFYGKAADVDSSPPLDQVEHIRLAVNGFRQSLDLAKQIAALYDVPTLFFLQPHTGYNYDLNLYRVPVSKSFQEMRPFFTGVYDKLKNDPGYIDLSGLFKEWGRKAVVDDVHYSPGFSQFLAQKVAQHIDVQSLKPRPIDVNAAARIASPR